MLPFVLLRPLAPYNDPPSSAPASTQLSSSTGIKFFVTGFLTVTYAVTIFSSLQTFLPSYIVGQFDVQTLEPAHAVTFFILLAALLPLGNAARSFLYTPSTFLARTSIDEKEFDPINATLGETVAHNIGINDWGKRETILFRRTAYLATLTIGTSIAKIYGTVEGAELIGAIGWGSVWAATGIVSCIGLVYIGDA